MPTSSTAQDTLLVKVPVVSRIKLLTLFLSKMNGVAEYTNANFINWRNLKLFINWQTLLMVLTSYHMTGVYILCIILGVNN